MATDKKPKSLDESIESIKNEIVAAKSEGNRQKLISLQNILKALMRKKAQ